MSEHLLNELGMLACHEEYCSARVPKIVQPDDREPHPLIKKSVLDGLR